MIIENGVLKQWGATRWVEVADVADKILKKTWKEVQSTDVTIPANVRQIGGLVREDDKERFREDIFYPAFMHVTSLTSVIMPDSVEVIGEKAFEHCDNLQMVRLSNTLKQIHINAFLGCKNLKTVFIPNSVTFIHEWAFSLCPNLVIHTHAGSYAEKYAHDNHIPLVVLT